MCLGLSAPLTRSLKKAFERAGKLAVCVLLSSGVPTLGAATNSISGEIAADTTWSGTNLVTGSVLVREAATVRIEAGTQLLFQAGASILVRGRVLATGSPAAPILFTRAAAGTRWERLMFVRSAGNRLQHCVIEYANSAGTHLDYYDNDCDLTTAPPSRNYHEALVLVASEAEIDGCVFQNLPDNSGTGEGDAIAVIADDPIEPGAASARIQGCRFLSIGQGIHTRYSHVLVEDCFFTGHHGDNDDVDLYGESTPPPLIRHNTFLNPSHDDMINPTRCSAVIVGNVLSGGDDHGIVLRDRCSPVVANNLIFNCASGGIAVQNQCDALLVNNTIVNCGRGIRLFDHTTRWGAPYCLDPGSGRATILNCIIWDCTTSLSLTDSPFTADRGSHVTVAYSAIEGGRAGASVSANSTLAWGEGNVSLDPRFTSTFQLQASSPLIDLGVDPRAVLSNASFTLTRDLDGRPRPLDGNGDAMARFDLGAFEYLLARADSNGDGIPDGWVWQHGMDPLDPGVAPANPDGDPHSNAQEWIADTDPLDALSYFRMAASAGASSNAVQFSSSTNRLYTLVSCANLATQSPGPVPGQERIAGTGGLLILGESVSEPRSSRFYTVRVQTD